MKIVGAFRVSTNTEIRRQMKIIELDLCDHVDL
jgi:hypothetical protein